MVGTLETLASVAFGSLLTYITQRSFNSKEEKRRIKENKIKAFTKLLKEDTINGPYYTSMEIGSFDYDLFKNKIYHVYMEAFYLFPKGVKFDDIYFWIVNTENTDLPDGVTKKELEIKLSDYYIKSILLIKEELNKLTN